MPQAKLPDINAAFVRYRSYYLSSMDSGNYSGATQALYAINALLPQEYKVEISSTKYEQKIIHNLTYQCNHCKEEIISNVIRIFDEVLPFFLSVITGNKKRKAWFCPSCKHVNSLLQTKMFQEELQEPYYLKIVPTKPSRVLGVSGRRKFELDVENWLRNFANELEAQIGLYRAEYEPIGSGIDESITGDENDD